MSNSEEQRSIVEVVEEEQDDLPVLEEVNITQEAPQENSVEPLPPITPEEEVVIPPSNAVVMPACEEEMILPALETIPRPIGKQEETKPTESEPVKEFIIRTPPPEEVPLPKPSIKLETLSIEELRELCDQSGLKSIGSKMRIIDRLKRNR